MGNINRKDKWTGKVDMWKNFQDLLISHAFLRFTAFFLFPSKGNLNIILPVNLLHLSVSCLFLKIFVKKYYDFLSDFTIGKLVKCSSRKLNWVKCMNVGLLKIKYICRNWGWFTFVRSNIIIYIILAIIYTVLLQT